MAALAPGHPPGGKIFCEHPIPPMRSDTLRQRMGWLHAWVGFMAGPLLIVIFSCGALATFDTEITRWMQPELSRNPSPKISPSGMGEALTEVRAMQAHGFVPLVILPSSRDPFLSVVHYDGASFIGTVLEPGSGLPLSRHITYGGTFFYLFHHNLFLPKPWGSIPTEIAALIMLVVLGAGIIIQLKRFLPDFLIFRLKGPLIRSWTDAHILIGLILVPFMAMMAYTGASIHAMRLFPAMSHARMHVGARPAMPPSTSLKPDEVIALLRRAEGIFGKGQVGFVTFTRDDVRFFRSDMAETIITRDAFIAYLPAATIRLERHAADLANVRGWLAGLHYARWASYPYRFLYFAGGLTGSWMMSAGLIIFLMKRRSANCRQFGFKSGEVVTIAATTALPLAMLAYIASSRLVPDSLIDARYIEIMTFFMVWILASAVAAHDVFCGRSLKAWRKQFLIISIFSLLIPVLDFETRHFARHDESLIYPVLDALAAFLGIATFYIARRLKS